MIGFAEEKMLPKLYEIWQECFDDEKAYIDSFFRCFHVTHTVLVCTDEKGEPASMLSVLPAFLDCQGHSRKAAYLYGVATAKKYQNQGYGSRLLQYAVKMIADDGAVPFLCPAQESLVSFYERNGFVTVSRSRGRTVSHYQHPEEISYLRSTEVSPEEYERLRNRAFGGKEFLRWPVQTLTYAERENAFYGGRMRKVRFQDAEYGVLYRITGQKMHILEITEADEEKADRIAAALLNSTEYVQTARLQRTVSAMAYGIPSEQEIWMNLSMG